MLILINHLLQVLEIQKKDLNFFTNFFEIIILLDFEREFLRKKLMRSGVDPLIVDIENGLDEIKVYSELMKKKI